MKVGILSLMPIAETIKLLMKTGNLDYSSSPYYCSLFASAELSPVCTMLRQRHCIAVVVS